MSLAVSTLVLLGELAALAILTRWIQQYIYTAWYLTLRSRSVAVTIVSLLLFPGTIIHELAHLFTAEVLGVRTGKLSLVPENIHGPEIRTGSVAIAQTDPFRRAIIGIAPFTVGVITLGIVSYFAFPTLTHVQTTSLWLLMLYLYLLFAISNSMFPSPTDLKGVWPVAILFILILVTGALLGVRVSLSGNALALAQSVLTQITKALGLVVLLNGSIALIHFVWIALTNRKP